MTAAVPIVINDGAATPVATTFNPEDITSGVSNFVDRLSGVAIGFRRLVVGTKFAKGSSKVNRTSYSVDYPVTQVVDGVTVVAYTLRAKLEMIHPDQATTAERNNLYAFVQNGLSNTLIRGALRDLDPIY